MFIHSIAKWSVEVTIALDSQITPLIVSRFNDTTHARWTGRTCSLPLKHQYAPFHRPDGVLAFHLHALLFGSMEVAS